ncbi:helix-turn-helix domain-containing protein [Granulosicoccus antarcticus]|uniref:HTH-type transcriptional activator RhaS n=1 Tax=Granulosicoccus antarcticus IMCC3135 TaxID=1192854 RepID=A0A2Z2P0Y5_9GAMM|nr:AraC family transcriptional regulator [Granulosicoccus antarcticus]ASJ76051.1 HTH-type transcriptional activator RhaS [Granulosicoccus antarcticus IMCC3135]
MQNTLIGPELSGFSSTFTLASCTCAYAAMLVLPIPLIVSILLAFLMMRASLRENPQKPLLLLIGLCALQSLIIALVHHYGWINMRWLQPLTASLIPPACWLVFASTTRRAFNVQTDALHAVLPLATLLSLVTMPAALDTIVPLNFVIYGRKLLAATSQDGDSLPGMRLESGELPRRLWRAIAFALLASAVCDALIILDQAIGSGHWLPVIVSLFTSVNLLLIGALCLSQELTQAQGQVCDLPARDLPANKETDDTEPLLSEENIQRDVEIMSQLSTLMNKEQLFLDADLTLTRLARKLGIPAKQVSAAINRQKGENVSRYVNRYRIDHAYKLLKAGKSITQTVYECGFNTKSNFNREFMRLSQASPSDWLTTQSG